MINQSWIGLFSFLSRGSAGYFFFLLLLLLLLLLLIVRSNQSARRSTTSAASAAKWEFADCFVLLVEIGTLFTARRRFFVSYRFVRFFALLAATTFLERKTPL